MSAAKRGVTPAQARQASLLRQRVTLALLEFGADLGVASVERIAEHAEELKGIRCQLDNLRAVMAWRERKAKCL
jgi:hypothetical protein